MCFNQVLTIKMVITVNENIKGHKRVIFIILHLHTRLLPTQTHTHILSITCPNLLLNLDLLN